MSSLMEVYQQLCKHDLLPEKRRKNFLTSIRYLAKSYDSTPEQLAVTRDLEATYAEHLRDYLTAEGKHLTREGQPSVTMRNTVQEVKQLLAQYHTLTHTAPVPVVTKPKPPTVKEAMNAMSASSPYRHQAWMAKSPYVLPPSRWSEEIQRHYQAWRQRRKDELRPTSMVGFTLGLESLLGYLHLRGAARLHRVHPETRRKLELKRYQDDREQILSTPTTVAWDDLFVLDHIKSFITWHAWRIHTPQQAEIRERAPSKPSTLGVRVAGTMLGFADIRPCRVCRALRPISGRPDDRP